MKKLSCGICVGPDYSHGIAYAIDCMKTASHFANNTLKFYLCLDPEVANQNSIDIIAKETSGIEKIFLSIEGDEKIVAKGHKRGGNVHGISLEKLIKFVPKHEKHLCIFDSDTCFLKKGWDDFMINSLTAPPREGKEKRIIYGADAFIHDKWRGFPVATFFIIDLEEFKNLNPPCDKYQYPFKKWDQLGFGPFNGLWVTVDENNQKYYNVELGTRIYFDVGAGILPSVMSTKFDHGVFKTKTWKTYCNHYDDEGQVFSSHMTNSRNIPYGSAKWLEWKNNISSL